jgi:hypothetical protein
MIDRFAALAALLCGLVHRYQFVRVNQYFLSGAASINNPFPRVKVFPFSKNYFT